MDERLITIASFGSVTEADFARMKLDMEGIECVMQDENTVAIQNLYNNLVGGIKLQVYASDVPRAMEILQIQPSAAMVQKPEVCPECGSADIKTGKFSLRMIFLSILLLGFPLTFLRRPRHCCACGHKWK